MLETVPDGVIAAEINRVVDKLDPTVVEICVDVDELTAATVPLNLTTFFGLRVLWLKAVYRAEISNWSCIWTRFEEIDSCDEAASNNRENLPTPS